MTFPQTGSSFHRLQLLGLAGDAAEIAAVDVQPMAVAYGTTSILEEILQAPICPKTS